MPDEIDGAQRKWASWLTVANAPADCLLICQCPKKDLRLAAPLEITA
jgi:hypothetical protein